MMLVNTFRSYYPELASELKLNHVINSLTYGDVSNHHHIKKRFGANNEHT